MRLLVVCVVCFAAFGADDRNFTGTWNFNPARSEVASLPYPPEPQLVVTHTGSGLIIASDQGKRTIATDGQASRPSIRSGSYSSMTKWEGSTLMINLLSTSGRQYSLAERWRLSRDTHTLTIRRVYQAGVGESESTLIYEREGAAAAPPPVEVTAHAPATGAAPRSSGPVAPAQPPPTPQPKEYVIEAGTRVLLRVNQAVTTKMSQQGDKVYLETAMPVAVTGNVIIPRGTQVTAIIKQAERASRGGGKSSLILEFDSIILPNGTHRAIRSRLSSADGRPIDRSEGAVRSERSKAQDAATVGSTAGIGASAGSMTGNGGIGAAIGAAAGLGRVLGSRGPDVVLPAGTTVEMTLDRTLTYADKELAGIVN